MIGGMTMVCAAALSAGALWVGLDLRDEPPAILCEGPWAVACERVWGGVRVALVDGAPDLVFDFVGLGETAALGYVAVGADGLPVGMGVGTVVPLADWEGVAAVTFYALSGEEDWAEVSSVSARERGVAGRGGRARPGAARADAAGGFPVYGPAAVLARLTTESPEVSVAGMTMDSPTARIDSLEALLVEGTFPSGEGAFSVALDEEAFLAVSPGTAFRAGADDTARVSIGGATSRIDGEHAFRWGNWATVPGTAGGGATLCPVSAAFSTVGGPYAFGLEGIADLRFYRQVGTIPFASLSVEPRSFTIPWSGAPLTGSVTYGPTDGRVSYAGPSCEGRS